MTMATVKAKVVQMGDVKIERIGTGELDLVRRGVVVQFDSVEDFRRAIDGDPVRLEWKSL